MSGKAMQGTIPPAGTVQLEMSRTMESEGHLNFSGLFSCPGKEHLRSQRVPGRNRRLSSP